MHDEITAPDTPVFIQDYHLALVAPGVRRRRPTARTALFWHIPWPYPDRLRICPWRRDILAGLLANDLLAFQLERDRRNFLLAVEEELNAQVEAESSRVVFEGRATTVVSVPIGVDYDRIQGLAADAGLADEQTRLRQLFGLTADVIGIGVDRLDYTKGIPERLAALDEVLTRRPELRGRLTFVQIGVPSRSEVGTYAAIEAEIGRRIAEVNARHAVAGRPVPIVYYQAPLTITSLVALYRLAHFCIVSSLHDGMNLVAKEFVAARDDDDGVLVLSALAGAAQELRDALIINPYDVDRVRPRARSGDRHACARAPCADARHAPRRRRTERIRLGLGHSRGTGKPVDQAAALLRAAVGGDVGVRRRTQAGPAAGQKNPPYAQWRDRRPGPFGPGAEAGLKRPALRSITGRLKPAPTRTARSYVGAGFSRPG